jgi:predicted dehydrogenase
MRKIAVVGTGTMGLIYAQLLHEHPEAQLVAIMGNSATKTESIASRWGARAIAGGKTTDLLKQCSDLDAVVVATPEWIRNEALLPLILKGIPILLEKPLCTSVEELRDLDQATQGQEHLISVTHSLRFSPRFSGAKDLLSKEAIGEIRHISTRRNPSLMSVQRVLGKFDLAYWLLCHDVDLIRWMTGQEVEWALATTRNRLQSEDDYLIVHFKLKSGIDTVCEISWCSPPISEVASQCAFVLKGTKGVLEVQDSEMNVRVYGPSAQVTSPDTYEHFSVGGAHYGTFHSLVDNWIRHLHGKDARTVSYSDARAAVQVCAMVSKSIQENRIVYASEI